MVSMRAGTLQGPGPWGERGGLQGLPHPDGGGSFLQRAGASTTEGEVSESPERADRAVAYVDGSFSQETGEFACGRCCSGRGSGCSSPRSITTRTCGRCATWPGRFWRRGGDSLLPGQGHPGLEIHHDYEGVGKWALGLWKANKPGTQAYAALCKQAMGRLDLTFVKVKGHSGNQWNDLADQLARRALGKEKSSK